MKGKWKILGLVCLLAVGLAVTGCSSDQSPRQKGEETQQNFMEEAQSQEPTYDVNHYLTRKYVNKWMKRMDTPTNVFYIYIFADTGNCVGYYVAQYKPISTATFLTPPDKAEDLGQSGPSVQAPALDGVYYGEGAGAEYFWFDAETDAMLNLKGLNYIASDKPLSINAEPINVKPVNASE